MAITHAPLVLAMIVPKSICRFIFPLMLIKHTVTIKEDATSLQLAPRRMCNCRSASIFYYLTSSRIGSSPQQNSIFFPKPVAQKSSQSSNSHGHLFFLRLQLFRRLFLFFLFPLFFPPSCFFRRLHPGESGADARVGPNRSVRNAGSSALGCRGVRLRGRLRGGRARN